MNRYFPFLDELFFVLYLQKAIDQGKEISFIRLVFKGFAVVEY